MILLIHFEILFLQLKNSAVRLLYSTSLTLARLDKISGR